MRTRTALPALLAALGLMFLLPATAHAHGDNVKVVVTGQREGHVTAEVTWENDGDAVDEAVAATVNAVSVDGTRTQGPWRLVRDPAAAPAGWTTAEVLPPGTWKVSVDVGFPALGHGELEVGVPVVDPAPVTSASAAGGATAGTSAGAGAGTTAAPAPVAPSQSPSPSVPAEQPDPRPQGAEAEAGDGSVWWTTAGVAATALAGAAVGLLLRRRRARRNRGAA
ncbi:hypothetical protein OG264_04295 [Streptomyces xanthophaeus]|uniref:hypothetical protein n=1 Tax=Streptomyces xanthophaeus TaxID=67385 RepID=UPI00386F3AE3|nr:hypothetical protein OG264_04295 [Streptomyces xanthophaeus]WST64227.1 hypothetical protein OG605_34065 [Streptomyces xanthophaeus]